MKQALTNLEKAKQKIRWIRNDIAFTLGQKLKYKPPPYSYRILIYHGIDQVGNLKYNSRFISQDYFEKQISYFRREYNIVSINDVFEQNLEKNQLNIAITFDDGYANNLKYALPVLEKYNVPATVFITTAQEKGEKYLWTDFLDIASGNYDDPIEIDGEKYIRDAKGEYISIRNHKTLKHICKEKGTNFKIKMKNAFPASFNIESIASEDYYLLLNINEIREMADNKLITIGSHGKYHNCLGIIKEADAKAEMMESKAFLEDITQKEIVHIAYPDGSYTRSLVEAAETMGYKYQLAVDYLYDDDEKDQRIMNRFGINPYISWNNQLLCITKGSYF